jgi:pyruvate,water dikinase
MNAQLKPREFPLPSSVKVVPGTERAQAAYPYHIQFSKTDDQKFWFYNSMHFPEPMSAFDGDGGSSLLRAGRGQHPGA